MSLRRIRILLADDHTLFRQGIKRVIHDNKDMFVAGEAENGIELIRKYFELLPDIMVVDIAMPEMSGLQAVENIRKKESRAKALFLSMNDSEDYVYKVIKSGGIGLVNKSILEGELHYAIEKIYNGERYFSGKWDDDKLNKLVSDYESIYSNPLHKRVELNFREEGILKMIIEGNTSKEIADKFKLSKRTVDFYRQSILRKSETNNQADLIKFGLEYFSSRDN